MSTLCVPSELQTRLDAVADRLPPDVELEYKKMFGGIGAYTRGRIFASLSDVGLALKLGEADQAALLREPDAAYLRYEPDSPPSKHYVVVPAHIRDDVEVFLPWVERSMVYVMTLPVTKKKKRG